MSAGTLAKRSLIRALSVSGLNHLLRPFYAGLGVIFMFHRVLAADEASLIPGISVTDAFLDEVLRYVKRRGWAVVSLSEAAEWVRHTGQGRRSRARFVCCTFDDGFRDNITRALPIFRSHGMPVSVFPTTGYLDRARAADGSLRYDVNFLYVPLEQFVLASDRVALPHPMIPAPMPARTAEEKARAFAALWSVEWADRHGFERAAVEMLQAGGVDIPTSLDRIYMGWDDVRALRAEPLVEVGAHGVTHRPLAPLSREALDAELTVPRERLGRALGRPITTLAYPYGGFAESATREFAAARAAGYIAAVTTRHGNVFPTHADHLLALPRVGVSMVPHSATLRYIEAALSGARNAVMNRFHRFAPA